MLISVRKAKSYYGYAHGQIWLWPFRSWDSKICFISRINWWTTTCCHYSANEMQDKNKNKLMGEFFTFRWLQNKITFFCKKHFNKQHQANIWFNEQQLLVLKGVKSKINIITGSLAEQRTLLLPYPYIHTNEKQCFNSHIHMLVINFIGYLN